MALTNLPSLPVRDGIRKAVTQVFAGYDHNLGAGDGSIWDEENMTSDYYPVMGTRAPRYTVRSVTAPSAFYALEGLWWVDGGTLYHDKNGVTSVTAVTPGEKQFAAMGQRLLVWPDKIVVRADNHAVKSLGTSVTANCEIKNGTYAGEEAEKNTVKCTDRDWSLSFSVGDAVHITGTGIDETPIIREIDGDELHFYENTFDFTGSLTLTLAREIPDLDFLCVNENRCWGCKGDTIYASKLGDPTNWNVFDGISTDSYAVDAGSEGEFTACCA